MKYEIKSLALASQGARKIEWASRHMGVLQSIQKRFQKDKPLKGLRLGACLHLTSETANLALTLQAGGAEVFLCASNPLSTQDDITASLVKYHHVAVFGIKGENKNTYYRHLKAVVQQKLDITLDDGADLTGLFHSDYPAYAQHVIGGQEETTTGVIRLRSLARSKKLLYPIIAVNDARTKNLFDNRYGTGQSTLDGVLRATNLLIAGKVFVVCGYGWCGKGLALRARGLGARVVVTEVDPIKALEALMDGFEVSPLSQAVSRTDILCTVTGNIHVVRPEHFLKMKEGAIIANAGHFNVELDLESLRKISRQIKRGIRPYTDQYLLKNGRSLFVLAEGRLVNLSCAEGHPAEVMDMSFATQALSCEYLVKNRQRLTVDVHPVPEEVEEQIARDKLQARGIRIDTLTAEQKTYLSSWEFGT